MSGPLAGEDAIRAAATRFRAALDAIAPASWGAIFIPDFPHGACGHASEMLGRYLSDTMGLAPEVVVKDFYEPDGEWRSGHAWLEQDGLIIDITGDQFGWPPVIVARASALHASGRDLQRDSLCTDANWWAAQCARLYAEARRWLDANADAAH